MRNKISILVVDDEPVNLAIITRRLEAEGYDVTTAEDGGQAIVKIRERIPDLVILDIMLPVLDGLQTLRLIKEHKPTVNTPVIILSALDDTETKVKALELGANDYITKPFRVEEFLARVKANIRPLVATAAATEMPEPISTISRPNKRDPYRLTGNMLSGRYSLTAYAGGGGMGAVYQAVDTKRQRVVAVKILKPDVVERSPEYAELFEKEVKNVQSLEHPHIVKVFDSGRDEEHSYMVMEWIEGMSLEDVITQGQLSIDRLTDIFAQICSAVAAAHEKNIIHLDIKPANILFLKSEKPGDFVKVIDFGLSRVITREAGTTVTKFRGTDKYCAPEQFGGRVSHRSDIYSLGATLYHMVCGVIPFGMSYINAKMHPNLELPEIPSVTRQREVSAEVDNVLKKALSREPNLRQQSALELFEEFSAALTQSALPEEQLQRLEKEVAELAPLPVNVLEEKLLVKEYKSLSHIRADVVLAEDLALRQLEAEFGVQFHRQMSISHGDKTIRIDGMAIDKEKKIMADIRFVREASIRNNVRNILAEIAYLASRLAALELREEVSLVFAVVSKDLKEESKQLINSYFNQMVKGISIPLEIRFFDFSELQERFQG